MQETDQELEDFFITRIYRGRQGRRSGPGAAAQKDARTRGTSALDAASGRVSDYSCQVAGDQTGRVDSWIWSVRLAGTRSAASGACRAGHVRVNGERVKPAHPVKAGDEVRLRHEGRERVVVVQRVITKRVGAPVAAECYVDNSPPPPPREEIAAVAVRDRGTGRPTKRERRITDKLLGRSAR